MSKLRHTSGKSGPHFRFNRAFEVRFGSIASDQAGSSFAPMSALPPIATKLVRRNEVTLSANWRPEQVQQIYLDKTALVDHLVGER